MGVCGVQSAPWCLSLQQVLLALSRKKVRTIREAAERCACHGPRPLLGVGVQEMGAGGRWLLGRMSLPRSCATFLG